MTEALVAGTAMFAGGLLAVLAWAGWTGIARRSTRRNLASALIGEIVAVLRTIESGGVVESLEPEQANVAPAKSVRPLILPHFTVYETNAGKLDLFAAPLPQKLAYFFDRLTTLAGEVIALAGNIPETTVNRSERIRLTRCEFRDTLDIADDILVALRQLASPNNQAKSLSHPPQRS
jgi:hypothetical protein